MDEQDKLLEIVQKSIKDFNDLEQYLIKNDLSERCICAKYAMYLTKALVDTTFETYVVDVEYNRGMYGKENGKKKLDGNFIVVDLIVHKRGYDLETGFDNLICIEMKKSTNRIGCGEDEQRLQKMVSYNYGFRYKLGVMLLANMKEFRLEIKDTFTSSSSKI